MSERRRPAALLLVAALLAGCADTPADEQSGSTRDARTAAVQVLADGCGAQTIVGAGSFVGDERVLTVAHVVAGATSVHVVLAGGQRVDATVVAIDRTKDLAVLAVDDDAAKGDGDAEAAGWLRRGSMRTRSKGTFVVYRDDRPLELRFEVVAAVDIDVAGIDGDDSAPRRGYELRAGVEQGDSGSVLVSEGVATGVVFARSTATGRRAWAIDIREADSLLAGADDTAVDVGACVGDVR